MAIPIPHLLIASVVLLFMLTGIGEAEANESLKAAPHQAAAMLEQQSTAKVCNHSKLAQ